MAPARAPAACVRFFFFFPRDPALAVHVSPLPLPRAECAEGAGAVECLCLRSGPRSVRQQTCYSWATPPSTAEPGEVPGERCCCLESGGRPSSQEMKGARLERGEREG